MYDIYIYMVPPGCSNIQKIILYSNLLKNESTYCKLHQIMIKGRYRGWGTIYIYMYILYTQYRLTVHNFLYALYTMNQTMKNRHINADCRKHGFPIHQPKAPEKIQASWGHLIDSFSGKHSRFHPVFVPRNFDQSINQSGFHEQLRFKLILNPEV